MNPILQAKINTWVRSKIEAGVAMSTAKWKEIIPDYMEIDFDVSTDNDEGYYYSTISHQDPYAYIKCTWRDPKTGIQREWKLFDCTEKAFDFRAILLEIFDAPIDQEFSHTAKTGLSEKSTVSAKEAENARLISELISAAIAEDINPALGRPIKKMTLPPLDDFDW